MPCSFCRLFCIITFKIKHFEKYKNPVLFAWGLNLKLFRYWTIICNFSYESIKLAFIIVITLFASEIPSQIWQLKTVVGFREQRQAELKWCEMIILEIDLAKDFCNSFNFADLSSMSIFLIFFFLHTHVSCRYTFYWLKSVRENAGNADWLRCKFSWLAMSKYKLIF